MPSASELLPYKPRLHNTMIKKRVNWGTKEARLPPCNQNRKRHCSPRSPSPGNSEPTVETQCWKRPRTREENEVKRERTVGVHSMESSPVLCQGCLALRWEFVGQIGILAVVFLIWTVTRLLAASMLLTTETPQGNAERVAGGWSSSQLTLDKSPIHHRADRYRQHIQTVFTPFFT